MVTAPVATQDQLGGLSRAAVLCPVERERTTGRLVPVRQSEPDHQGPDGASTGDGYRPAQHRLDEAVGLGRAINLDVVESALVRVNAVQPATLLGQGAVAEWGARLSELEIDVAVVDAALTPIQQRNLERAWQVKVLDRTALILEIFGARARSRAGQLQVELAALTFQRSRLVRSWTHLERQRGGLGFIGGPGESQLELDRRLIDSRIDQIKRALADVRRTRRLQRADRSTRPHPVVALVGYTNAGKSTLFNRITDAGRYSDDLLFATLDTKMRAVALPSGRQLILSDTVGFISDLPHQLVEAFQATLEEVDDADLIVHVRDAAHPDSAAQRSDVVGVLGELGIDAERDPRLVEVHNKLDQVTGSARAELLTQTAARSRALAVSAATGEGIEALLARLDELLAGDLEKVRTAVPHSDGKALAWLYDHGEVVERRDDEAHAHLVVRLRPADSARFRERWGGLARMEEAAS